MLVMPCPSTVKSCQFMKLDRMNAAEASSVVSMVKKAFPHMNIPEYFWKTKLVVDPTIVLKKNGEDIVAAANVSMSDNGASLDMIAVSPELQGNGVGGAMLDFVERNVKGAGKKQVRLLTESDKTENVAFYSKHGYKITSYEKNAYSHGAGVRMEKDI